ncbi:hypothetical protein ACP3WW_24120, partial [Salmonella enterica]|uniref:hypothetical protein n=1 Tax=Salmonella enterica TaxID=28901 RepID=UPI003CF36CC4
AFAARLVEDHDVDADDVGLVRDALERTVYAEDGMDPARGPALADAVERIRERLRAGASAAGRVRALLLPRSLLLRG